MVAEDDENMLKSSIKLNNPPLFHHFRCLTLNIRTKQYLKCVFVKYKSITFCKFSVFKCKILYLITIILMTCACFPSYNIVLDCIHKYVQNSFIICRFDLYILLSVLYSYVIFNYFIYNIKYIILSKYTCREIICNSYAVEILSGIFKTIKNIIHKQQFHRI